MPFSKSDPTLLVVRLLILFVAIGLHEYAHAKVADSAGDPTPAYFGRVTLNLFSHFDPLGALMILLTTLSGFGIGWGKPVPVNPTKMRNPRWDHFWTVAAGPLCNILQAIAYAAIFRLVMFAGIQSSLLVLILFFGVFINLGLALFNLIPLGPLDGHWLVGAFLPEQARAKWFLWNRKMGSLVLLGLIILSQTAGDKNPQYDILGTIIGPALEKVASVLLGT